MNVNDIKQYVSQDAIRALMRDGAKPEDIAKVFTEQINAVLAEQNTNAQKSKDAKVVVDFLVKYYPVIFEGLTIETFLKALDDLQEVLEPIAKAVDEVKASLDNKENVKKEIKVTPDKANMSFDDLLQMFSK